MVDSTEIFVQSLRCAGQFQNTVFVSPPNVCVVMGDQPKKYTVGIRHISNQPIKITSISPSKSVQYRKNSETFNREQSIELTILPAILETGTENVRIEGMIEGGETFSLAIPVSAFSQRIPNQVEKK